MLEILKRTMFAGVGLALKTKAEAEEIARDFVKKTELSESEGKKFINDFLKRYDESRDKLEDRVEKTVKDILNKTNVATKDELAEIKKEIQSLKSS